MITLQPLLCANCRTNLPAYPDEVAWRCSNCGVGWQLSDTAPTGLEMLSLHFDARCNPQVHGRPFWVASGMVGLNRDTFSGDESKKATQVWAQPRQFFVPAFTCPLDTLIELGRELLLKPPGLQPGEPARFTAVTLLPKDVRALAEFIVMSLEAERSDKIETITFDLRLQKPELWVLP
ncbi:MAG: hypothetical protein ACT4QE_06735, partial [Anaerolineales bacterium]